MLRWCMHFLCKSLACWCRTGCWFNTVHLWGHWILDLVSLLSKHLVGQLYSSDVWCGVASRTDIVKTCVIKRLAFVLKIQYWLYVQYSRKKKKCWQSGKASVNEESLQAFATATFWWWALIPLSICTSNEHKNIHFVHMRSTHIRKVATSSIWIFQPSRTKPTFHILGDVGYPKKWPSKNSCMLRSCK